MINQSLGKIIDELRQERKMSRENLCEEVMSIRNYQRFINEEVNVSNDKLSKLIDRLSLDYFTVREISRYRGEGRYTVLHNVYNLMQANSDEKAYQILLEINLEDIESDYTKLFYQYLKIDLERQLHKISQEDAVNQLKELIHYPRILDYEVLNFIELNVLVILNLHYSKLEDDTIAQFLYQFLLNENLPEKGLSESFLPSLYASTAQSLGTFKQYEQALEISDKGIKECMRLKLFNTLHQLFFFKALSHNKLNQDTKALETLQRLYALLHTLNEPDKTVEYQNNIAAIFHKEITISFHNKDTE